MKSLDKKKSKPKKLTGWEKCRRCGKPYPVKGVMVCPCHSMFDKDYNWDDGYFDFKTPNDAQKCLKWIDNLLSHQRQEILDQVEREVIGEGVGVFVKEMGEPLLSEMKRRGEQVGMNRLIAEQRLKLSALRLEGKKEEK